MTKLSERQKEQVEYDRALEVYKRDDMIQEARFTLSVQEQRAVLYAIAKIKPEDTQMTEYTFDMKDFYNVIGWEKESYTEFKRMLKALGDKSWWVKDKETGVETLVRWFAKIKVDIKGNKATFKFDEDMIPYLLKLADQGMFYTSYSLQYVLPMQSQYSPRLYEILKSYQKNNKEWYFDTEDLKCRLDCQNYKRWPDFRRRALEPAIEEINKYTDLNIAYYPQKEGNRVARIVFFLNAKSPAALTNAKKEIARVLDDVDPNQMTVFDLMGDEHEQAWRAAQEQFRRVNQGKEQE